MSGGVSRATGLGCRLVLVSVLAGGCASTPTPEEPPVITDFDPASGPTGTIVTVRGQRFGQGGTILFDGSAVATRGSGSPLVFTVPYDATVGNHVFEARIGSVTSVGATFDVTAVSAGPTPVVDGAAVGHYSVGAAGDETIIELVVFGTGFDTNGGIVFDGSDVSTLTPGIPANNLLGVLAAAVVPQYPPEHWDKALAALLSANNGGLPALGSTHTVSVRNTVTGVVSNQISVTIPSRRVLVEMDKVDGVAFPPAAIFQNAQMNTLRRSYTEAGFLIDRRLDQSVPDPLAGSAFSDADVLDFFDANNNLGVGVFQDEFYFHVSLVTTRDEPNPNFTTFGRMYDASNRQGMVVFVNSLPANTNYLRSLAHEMGHGFNLSHCEGDAVAQRDGSGNLVFDNNGLMQFSTLGTTIMNQTIGLGPNPTFNFSAASQTHLTQHAQDEVEPGPGNIAFNSSDRVEGACDH